MISKCDIVGETGLQFYGKMCASMSHDIKNALAIIQEHSGLLDDFTTMAKEGIPIDPQRVKILAGKIQGQIDRANGIVKRLNRLAHSVDEPTKTVDIAEMMTLMVALSQRLASARGVAIEAKIPESVVPLQTAPFFLQNLLWLCLDYSMDAAGDKKSIILAAQPSDQGVAFRFSQLEGLADAILRRFPAKPEEALLQALGAVMKIDHKGGEILLEVPGETK